MKASIVSKISIAVLILLAFLSCKESAPHFVIEGKVADSDSSTLYLEIRSLSDAKVIDSVTLNKEGTFKFEKPALQYSEFYILRMNGQSIHLSIDSTETVKVTTGKNTFATDYSIEGSESSAKIKKVSLAQYKLANEIGRLNKSFASKSITDTEYFEEIDKSVKEYKEVATEVIRNDFRDPAAYFAIFQKVEGFLIFDPHSKDDLHLFQAVATAWDQFKPNSPRSAQIKEFTLNAVSQFRKEREGIEKLNNIALNEVATEDYFNIELPNLKGEKVALSSLKGKAVILDFTVYGSEFSPNHNIVLNSIYKKYKGSLEIYQVSLDSELHTWQNSANNLPWICVREGQGLQSQLVSKFNIQNLPTTYLMDKKGNIVKRILPDDKLENEVQKIIK